MTISNNLLIYSNDDNTNGDFNVKHRLLLSYKLFFLNLLPPLICPGLFDIVFTTLIVPKALLNFGNAFTFHLHSIKFER